MNYDPDAIKALQYEIRTEGLYPLQCPECRNITMRPLGETVCNLCRMDADLADRLELKPRKDIK